MRYMIKRPVLLLSLVGCTVSALAGDKLDFSKLDLSKLPPVADKNPVTYATDIRPLFEASCVRCHGEQKPKGHLRLDSLEGVLKGGEDGKVVVPGNSKQSLLVVAVARIDPDTAMPPKPGPGRGGPGRPGGGGGGPGASGDAHGPNGGGAPAPGGGPGRFGPPPKPLTTEQVSLVRAWIEQGAK